MRIDLGLQDRQLTLPLLQDQDVILIDQLPDIRYHLIEAGSHLPHFIIRLNLYLLFKIPLPELHHSFTDRLQGLADPFGQCMYDRPHGKYHAEQKQKRYINYLPQKIKKPLSRHDFADMPSGIRNRTGINLPFSLCAVILCSSRQPFLLQILPHFILHIPIADDFVAAFI